MVKSRFFCKEVEFLGMVVKEGHITVNRKKIQKILDLNPPRTLRQLRGFLGMASYYWKYIKDYSRVAAPLIALTKQDKDYRWDGSCDRAFRDIKTLLSSEPILTLPNQRDPFILAVDFSYEGMGLVFS